MTPHEALGIMLAAQKACRDMRDVVGHVDAGDAIMAIGKVAKKLAEKIVDENWPEEKRMTS